MFTRLITDNFKAFFQSLGLIDQIGLYTSLNFLIFLAVSYFVMSYLNLQEIGYAISIGIYEFNGLMICLYLYFFKLDPKIRENYSLSIADNFCWYGLEAVKASLIELPNEILIELLLFVVVYKGNSDQVAVFSVVENSGNVVFCGSYGFNAY